MRWPGRPSGNQLRLREEFSIALIEHETSGGKLDRRAYQFRARARSVRLAGELEAGDRAGNTGRQIPPCRQLRHRVATRVEEQGTRRRGWGRLAKIDERLAAIGHADQHEAAAPQVSGFGKGHGQCIRRGNRRIDRIPAFPEHCDTGLAREPMEDTTMPRSAPCGTGEAASVPPAASASSTSANLVSNEVLRRPTHAFGLTKMKRAGKPRLSRPTLRLGRSVKK